MFLSSVISNIFAQCLFLYTLRTSELFSDYSPIKIIPTLFSN